jgi:transcriptional accessory protein Tex/SPT6
MPEVKRLDFSRIAQDLQVRKTQVESVVQLLDEGNTVPFITRYRKERTGSLNEEQIRQIQARVTQLRQLADRKDTILRSIEGQGKLTDDLRVAIMGAETIKRLEDLYLPYKPKKRTLATVARERGLEPLALAIWNKDPAVANLAELLPTMVNPEKELATAEDVRLGVQHILAEQIAETAGVRAAARSELWESGKLTAAKSENLAEGQGLDYRDYFQFTEPVRQIPPHRILAINRGEKESSLKVRLEWDADAVRRAALSKLPLADHPHADFLHAVTEDALSRLLLPSLEREIRRELTEIAEAHAVKVFARNLRSLLLQPPLRNRRILAIDPGFRTGCKVAALDEGGNRVDDAVIFPHPPQNKKQEAKAKLEELLRKHQLNVIAIGNGTACRETEEVVAELIGDLEKRRKGVAESQPAPSSPSAVAPAAGAAVAQISEVIVSAAGVTTSATELALAPAGGTALAEAPSSPAPRDESAVGAVQAAGSVCAPGANPGLDASRSPATDSALPPVPDDLAYVIVNEAGASVYSASAIGREEFPDYDATLRGTISIGRRLQDPLSELVKIDPQSIGVGLYQHDINSRTLKESLDSVIESSVNQVGIDLNTASVPLLRHVSGLNQLVAREIVDYRKQHGSFKTREQLLQVPNIGPNRFIQAAGFLKIVGGDNPLDQTWIHPESYPAAQQLLAELGFGLDALNERQKTTELSEKLRSLSPEEISSKLQLGVPTLRDILEALARPGRDPRDDLPPPIFKRGVLKLEDLQPGMELKGTVLNVVDFGAFVDIGLKDSGLVHISQIANRYVKNPYDVVAVGDVVTVWVLSVDQGRRRVSLTMIKPGTPRQVPMRRTQESRPERSARPPRGRRPAPAKAARAQQVVEAAPVVVATPAPAPAPPPQSATPAPAPAAASAPAPKPPPSRPAPPPRKPKRHVAKPKLSQDALQRKVPLRSFSELEVFFETKTDEGQPPA